MEGLDACCWSTLHFGIRSGPALVCAGVLAGASPGLGFGAAVLRRAAMKLSLVPLSGLKQAGTVVHFSDARGHWRGRGNSDTSARAPESTEVAMTGGRSDKLTCSDQLQRRAARQRTGGPGRRALCCTLSPKCGT